MDARLENTMKELQIFKAALPLKKCKAVLSKSKLLSDSISWVAKKFALLCYLWIIDSLFPILDNPNVDLFNVGHWASSESKHNAIVTELFMIMPKTLHKQMPTYKSFSSVVCGLSYFNLYQW